jgi:hypothetical protein
MGGVSSREIAGDAFRRVIVGWVERSETHQLPRKLSMGFAALYPSYKALRSTHPRNPTGKSAKTCPSLAQKIFRLTRRANQRYHFAHLVPTRGAFAIVTKRGAGCGGRGCAFDERRAMRTAKACGPDAPMLASSPLRSKRFSGATVATKPVTGESAIYAVKPLRGEGRSVSAEPVCSCAFFCAACTRDRGCSAHPVFPAPSDFKGRKFQENLAQIMRRDRGAAFGPSGRGIQLQVTAVSPKRPRYSK